MGDEHDHEDRGLLPYTKGTPGWERVESAVKGGLCFGAVIGAIKGNWDFNTVVRETSMAALSKSATTMGATMLLYSGVAFTYAATEAALESLRGKADWRNGAMAGFASGSIAGLHTGKIGTAVSAGLLFCAASVAVDMTGGRLRANVFQADMAPSNPYPNRFDLPKY